MLQVRLDRHGTRPTARPTIERTADSRLGATVQVHRVAKTDKREISSAWDATSCRARQPVQLGVQRMHLPIAWQDHIEIVQVEIGDALGWDQCDQARTTLGFPA
jgi:hypothetical protein